MEFSAWIRKNNGIKNIIVILFIYPLQWHFVMLHKCTHSVMTHLPTGMENYSFGLEKGMEKGKDFCQC